MTDVVSESIAPTGEQLFDALCILEARCRDKAAGLPQPAALSDVHACVLFRIAEISLLVPLNEVGEILEVPREITPIPGTRDWVLGIANNRGTLLPMFDLRAFLFGFPTSSSGRNRVLVVRRDEFPVGLLVSDVTGIRHFDATSHSEQVPDLPHALGSFLSGGFKQGRRLYAVFSVRQLTQDARFNLTGA